MAKLNITDVQKTTIVDPLDSLLRSALEDGVASPSFPSLLDGLPFFKRLSDLQKQQTIDSYRLVGAAFSGVLGGGGGGGAITLLGDVTGTGTGTVNTTLASVATPGTFPKVTFNAKGLVTGGTTLIEADVPDLSFSKIIGRPTTLAGYGIGDATPLTHVGSTGTAQHGVATTSLAGFMSVTDKVKLDALTAPAPSVSVARVEGTAFSPASINLTTEGPLGWSWFPAGAATAPSSHQKATGDRVLSRSFVPILKGPSSSSIGTAVTLTVTISSLDTTGLNTNTVNAQNVTTGSNSQFLLSSNANYTAANDGLGYVFSAPASQSPRTLKVYTGHTNCNLVFVTRLESTGATTTTTLATPAGGASSCTVWTITYTGSTPSDLLHIHYYMNNGVTTANAVIRFFAASLA